jgi:hypothetical protein
VWDSNTRTYHEEHAFFKRVGLYDSSLMDYLDNTLPLFNLANDLAIKLDGLDAGVYCSNTLHGTVQVCLNVVKRHDNYYLYYSASHSCGSYEKLSTSLEQKKYFLEIEEMDKMCLLMKDLDTMARAEGRPDSRAIYEKAISI